MVGSSHVSLNQVSILKIKNNILYDIFPQEPRQPSEKGRKVVSGWGEGEGK